MTKPLDHDRQKPLWLWRQGCRCASCAAAHNAEITKGRRAAAARAYPESSRSRSALLDAIRLGASVPAAAAAVGRTIGQVYAWAVVDPAFAAALDEATWTLCVLGRDNPRCSTAAAYRVDACRGTGCREYRRESSRRTRA